MKVNVIPALEDNYMYLIIDETTKTAAIVDPVEPGKVIAAAKLAGVDLTTVLTTHHHWDHAGGNAELLTLKNDLKVYGGDSNIAGIEKTVQHGDEFNVGELHVKALLTPCHTKGHVCYFIEEKNKASPPAVFTGDTLFSGGCGKFFEGTPEQMYQALVKILGSLPDNTQVYCGHEYTANNLLFAVEVEPENKNVQEKFIWAKRMKATGKETVPSTIGEEKTFNPFMRVHEAAVQKYAGLQDPVAVMEKLRNKKNNFTKRL